MTAVGLIKRSTTAVGWPMVSITPITHFPTARPFSLKVRETDVSAEAIQLSFCLFFLLAALVVLPYNVVFWPKGHCGSDSFVFLGSGKEPVVLGSCDSTLDQLNRTEFVHCCRWFYPHQLLFKILFLSGTLSPGAKRHCSFLRKLWTLTSKSYLPLRREYQDTWNFFLSHFWSSSLIYFQPSLFQEAAIYGLFLISIRFWPLVILGVWEKRIRTLLPTGAVTYGPAEGGVTDWSYSHSLVHVFTCLTFVTFAVLGSPTSETGQRGGYWGEGKLVWG